jgi:phosphoglycerate dehydrogenase-like enzyme
MRVLASDPVAPDAAFAECGAERVSFEDLLDRSDVVSVHAPLLPQTRRLMDAGALARMRPGAILINTARGGIVDQAALVDALDRGMLRGAALDVLEEEPPPPDDPLLASTDVLLTPHAGFLSLESLAAVQEQAADEVRLALLGQVPRNAVNAAPVEARRAAPTARD